MRFDELKKPIYTIKQTAEMLVVHERTVVRMLKDGRLQGELLDTPRGKIWIVSPISIATLLVRKSDLGNKQYPRAKKKEK
jgi:excisionase family DNA binding protein